ncbi:MAG: hypothetical protein ACXU86_22220, partial [Archangium sp.]
MSLGLYLHRDSPVHDVRAGAKMLGLLAASTGLLLCSSLPVLGAALGGLRCHRACHRTPSSGVSR